MCRRVCVCDARYQLTQTQFEDNGRAQLWNVRDVVCDLHVCRARRLAHDADGDGETFLGFRHGGRERLLRRLPTVRVLGR